MPHRHEVEGQESLRPRGSRVESGVHDQRVRAAVDGWSELLDADAVTGLQRTAGNAAVTSMLDDEDRSPVHAVINSPGRPLETDVRSDMEGRLGADLSDVRVHDDAAADASATAVNAHAYTVGSNVVFQRDQFDPDSTAGRITLAHELTHVLQQRSGPVDGTDATGGIKISDPSDRFEREATANAERVMSDRPGVQRQQDADEELPEEQAQPNVGQSEPDVEEEEWSS